MAAATVLAAGRGGEQEGVPPPSTSGKLLVPARLGAPQRGHLVLEHHCDRKCVNVVGEITREQNSAPRHWATGPGSVHTRHTMFNSEKKLYN